MREDIEFHTATDVLIAAVKEWDKDFLAQSWNIYLINTSEEILEVVLVVSSGYDANRKTATLRHALGNIPAKSFKMVEFVAEEVLSFTNQFMLTFFIGNTLYEKKFTFPEHTISEEKLTKLPILDLEGVLAD